jgi:hypothetical protein
VIGADSDEVSRVYRNDFSHRTDLISPSTPFWLVVFCAIKNALRSTFLGYSDGSGADFPAEIDAMSIVYETVEDGVGIGWVAEYARVLPFPKG